MAVNSWTRLPLPLVSHPPTPSHRPPPAAPASQLPRRLAGGRAPHPQGPDAAAQPGADQRDSAAPAQPLAARLAGEQGRGEAGCWPGVAWSGWAGPGLAGRAAPAPNLYLRHAVVRRPQSKGSAALCCKPPRWLSGLARPRLPRASLHAAHWPAPTELPTPSPQVYRNGGDWGRKFSTLPSTAELKMNRCHYWDGERVRIDANAHVGRWAVAGCVCHRGDWGWQHGARQG